MSHYEQSLESQGELIRILEEVAARPGVDEVVVAKLQAAIFLAKGVGGQLAFLSQVSDKIKEKKRKHQECQTEPQVSTQVRTQVGTINKESREGIKELRKEPQTVGFVEPGDRFAASMSGGTDRITRLWLEAHPKAKVTGLTKQVATKLEYLIGSSYTDAQILGGMKAYLKTCEALAAQGKPGIYLADLKMFSDKPDGWIAEGERANADEPLARDPYMSLEEMKTREVQA